MDDAELPKALIKRIARAKLSRLEQTAGLAEGRETQVSKDALLALAESARVFINYLTATGHDICKEAKRQIISADDVLVALEDLEFPEILPPLRESLEVFKAESKEKSKKRAEQLKKRKLEGAEAAAAAAAAATIAEPAAGNRTAGPETEGEVHDALVGSSEPMEMVASQTDAVQTEA